MVGIKTLFPARNKTAAFTLLEVLLVVALVGILTTLMLPNVSRIFRVSVQSSVRRFGALVRYAYDQAVLTGKLHRIVLNIDEQKWYLEFAEDGALPIDKIRQGLLADGLHEKDRVTPEPKFKKSEKANVEELPKGVRLMAVQSFRYDKGKPQTKGELSIYAFPNGFIDEVTVFLAEQGARHTQKFKVKTKSLTGRVEFESSKEEVPEQ